MNERIKHMVIFCLKHEKDSPLINQFLIDGKTVLTSIPGVENFEVYYQISHKNDYDYGFSMEFKNQQAYQAYNDHPLHVEFVSKRWLTEVSRFLEIDFKLY